jgi:uncharacterized peroxidase-related enzyme|tara:strand:- start:712 stop:1299 length:588 start_codon:yes stop_codon:yes gene_type:complete
MPLVNPIEITDQSVKELVKFFNETLGFCPNSVLTMQRRPNIAKAFVELNMAVMENHGQLTSEFKRLIAFVSSNTAGCRYCQAHTIRAAERYGSTSERLEHVWDFKNQDFFTDAEKAALQFAQEASIFPVNVAEDTEKQLHNFWSDDDIVEIMGVIALFGYLNRWNDVMATSIEDDAYNSGKDLLKGISWVPGKHA